MTVIPVNQIGEYHIVIRLKGTPEKINLFHRVMLKCDPEWPWKSTMVSQYVCRRCGGMSYHSPRIQPHDIKVAAKQVGGVKVKIRNFAPLKNCRGSNMSYDYQNDRVRVTIKEVHELYGPHGVANFFAKYNTTTVPHTPSVVEAPTPLALPPASSEAILINTVLSEQEPATPNTITSEGSLTQYHGEDEMCGWVM